MRFQIYSLTCTFPIKRFIENTVIVELVQEKRSHFIACPYSKLSVKYWCQGFIFLIF
jgi:hypothetical protein